MKFFLTGGTGFLGSHFLQKALSNGHTVLAHRRSISSRPKIPILCEPEWLDCEFNQITSSDLIGCDILVHLMAHSVQYPFDNLSICLNYNLIQVLDLFEKARLAGISHFLVAGSCFEYGTSGERYDFIPTHAPLEPTNSYAVSKAAASIALNQWANEHSLGLEILRILKPDGLFFLNVPSNGIYHRQSTDNWRFYPDSIIALEKWGRKNNFNPKVLEHFTLDHRGREIWCDYVSVTIKDEKFCNKFPDRIINKIQNFRNGRTNNSEKILNYTMAPQDMSHWGWALYYKVRKILNKINKKY